MGKNNNRYDDEFKANAVKLVVEKGRSLNAVAKDLGVSIINNTIERLSE